MPHDTFRTITTKVSVSASRPSDTVRVNVMSVVDVTPGAVNIRFGPDRVIRGMLSLVHEYVRASESGSLEPEPYRVMPTPS